MRRSARGAFGSALGDHVLQMIIVRWHRADALAFNETTMLN